MILGHRGAVHPTAPENTLASVERALRNGADGVEVDVRVTADGVPVCHHDADLIRTAADPRQVSTTLYENLPWLGAHRVPRLSEIIELVSGRGRLVVEVKAPPGLQDASRLRDDVTAVAGVLRRQRTGHVTLSSFDRMRLKMLRQLDPRCPTALLGRPAAPFAALVVQAEQDGHEEIHPHVSSVLTSLRADPHLLLGGPRVTVWTVDRPNDLLRLRAAGAGAVIADDPRSARDALGDPIAAAV